MSSEHFLKILLVIAFAVVGLTCASCFNTSKNNNLPQSEVIHRNILQALDSEKKDVRFQPVCGFTKYDVRKIIDSSVIFNAKTSDLDIRYNAHPLHIETSLDTELQKSIWKRISKSSARRIAVVVLEPETGRIISMIGFDRDNISANPCTSSCFPAASIFKMITAAAAIDHNDFRPDTRLKFNGRKHTLYKSQLRETANRYTNRTTLMDSFAQSVNPVFGKIGIFTLGKGILEKYAYAFGFEREFNFDIPVAQSRFSIEDDSYRIAEIASGFNRETVITPLHGALITATAINRGAIMEPAVVDSIEDADGKVLYRNRSELLSQAICPDSANILKKLLKATVTRGTAKKAFRGWRRDRILSKLDIGGKTGTIDSRDHKVRYDWFCGFAQDNKSGRKIAISVLVGHAKPKLDIKAANYARHTIRDYFSHVPKLQLAASRLN